ncbi:MAG: S9 family peptidase, partial [Armatimonadetes bacterium]|nr:S9 family peptidase [Armatimonadota bacterium]
AFLSDRGDETQLWLIPSDGGEARQLTRLPEGSIGEFAWSPDGTRIAFTFRPKPEWARKKCVEARKEKNLSTPPLVVSRLAYREEGGGYFGDERWHIHVLGVETGACHAATEGPTDQHSLAWSPDGERIAFLTNRTRDPDCSPQYIEIRVVGSNPEQAGQEEPVVAPAGPKHQLAWSPDGSWLAYFGNLDTTDVWSGVDPHLWVIPARGGSGRDLTQELDRPVGDATLGDLRSFGGGWGGPTFSPDSRWIYFLVSDRGACHLYRASPSGGTPECLTPGLRGEIASLSLDATGAQVASVVGDSMRPGDVEVLDLAQAPVGYRTLTRLNNGILSELRLAVPEEFAAPGEAGPVHGWLLRPPGEVDQESAPLILYIHGGPHTQYGWCLMHEIQTLAARGFAVLYTNPRGSRGYGQAHVSAIRGDWGGADYRDLMAAVDHALTLPGLDPNRLGVTGGSYGGYMTNWIVGHSDRFRCAVTQRSVVNLHSMAGTCDFNFSESTYFDGNVWERPERYLEQSPLLSAANVGTPMLILHSEGDLRCPIEQAEQWYGALKRQEKVVEFVRYPREANHGLSRSGPPDLRLDRIERIAAWMHRWLCPGPA